MLSVRWSCGLLLAGVFSVGASVSCAATSIRYQAIDLADVVAGEDLWRYAYTVSGSFDAFYSFEILFDAQAFASLESAPAAPNTDWLVSAVQPVPAIPVDGVYSALALVANASLASPFEVAFVWNGPGLPGAQPFNVLDDTFGLVESATTIPIPEPRIYGLMGAGLLLLALRLRRRSR